jgi:hypothetical protein
MELISVVRNSLSNCIPFMVYEMDIMFHLVHVHIIISFSMSLIGRKFSNLFVWIFILRRTQCVSAKDFRSGWYVLRPLRYMAFAALLRSFGSSFVKDTDIDWIIYWNQMQFLGDAQWKGVKLDWRLTLQQKKWTQSWIWWIYFCSDTVRENIDLSMIENHIYLDLIIVKNLKKMDYFLFLYI